MSGSGRSTEDRRDNDLTFYRALKICAVVLWVSTPQDVSKDLRKQSQERERRTFSDVTFKFVSTSLPKRIWRY